MSVMIIGDTHARHAVIERAAAEAARKGVTNLIQVGDFGADFTRTFVNRLDEITRKYGVTIRFADGNHEDHRFLRSLPECADGSRLLTGKVLYQPRGSVATIDGARVMFCGGAVSVNRAYLKKRGRLWQPEEAITEQDVSRAAAAGEVDVLISHEAPASATLPEHLFHLEAAQDAMADAQQSRDLLQEVVNTAKPSAIYHGHYHHLVKTTTTLPSGLHIPTTGLAADGSAGSRIVATLPRKKDI